MSTEKGPHTTNPLLALIDINKERLRGNCNLYMKIIEVIDTTPQFMNPDGSQRKLASIYAQAVHNSPNIAHKPFCKLYANEPLPTTE